MDARRATHAVADTAHVLAVAQLVARFLELESLQQRQQQKIYESYLDREVQVLVERRSSKSDRDMTGHSTCHKVVNFPRASVTAGQVARVRVTEAKVNSLYGEILSAA